MRKIIHIDMDAFYASVELRERPDLHNQPVVIASHHPRAVIAAASYPARVFGLHSAMSVSQAKKRCPHLVVIEPNFQKYREVSAEIHTIFQQYTNLIEPISLDEAYLDVTENLQAIDTATEIAQRIRAQVLSSTGLTCSAGVAPNKFLAKIASDWHKPNGICVIKPSQVQRFIQDLALKKIPGVGNVTQEKLSTLKLYTLGDLQKIEPEFLIQHFGKYGKQLLLYAQGIDDRPVEANRERQQISKEITFNTDLFLSECEPYWQPLIDQVWQSLSVKKLHASGVTVKLKTNSFKVIQHSRRFRQPLTHRNDIQNVMRQLISEMYLDAQLKFRLIGIGLYQLTAQDDEQQLSLI